MWKKRAMKTASISELVVAARLAHVIYLFFMRLDINMLPARAKVGRGKKLVEEEHIRMRWCRFSRGYEMRGLKSCEEPPGDNAMAWDVLKHFERESDWVRR